MNKEDDQSKTTFRFQTADMVNESEPILSTQNLI